MLIVNMMSEEEFLTCTNSLDGMDRQCLQMALNVLVAVFLKQQPGKNLRDQRVAPGVPFKVWDPKETSVQALQAMSGGSAQAALARNAHIRKNVETLARFFWIRIYPPHQVALNKKSGHSFSIYELRQSQTILNYFISSYFPIFNHLQDGWDIQKI